MKLQMKPHNQKGKLITFCGLDGCGKTTQINLLKAYLESEGIPTVVTKQPSNSVRQLDMFRNFQESPNHKGYDYRALSLLCASDRVQHCNNFILPLLEKGFTVISDRYYYSCVANLRARGYLEDKWIQEISQHIPKPDYAFFLDASVDLATKRVHDRPQERDLYIDMDLQHKLRDQYLILAQKNDGILLETDNRPEATFQQICQELNFAKS